MHPADGEMDTPLPPTAVLGARSTERPPSGPDALTECLPEMRRLYLEGEIGAALDLAASVHPPAPALLRDAVPFVRDDAPNADELVTDPRAAFVLAQVDGVSDVSKLVTELPMPDDEAFGVLAALVEVGVLGTRTSSVG